MRYLLFTFIIIFIIGSCVSDKQVIDESLTDISEYELVWADEFDYKGKPDKTKWDFDIGGFGWWNNELQYYSNRPENVRVENGILIIEARKEDYKVGVKINHYTSARIKTKHKGDWCYGRIEVRAKLPHGKGIWPAIWMMPTKDKYGGWPRSGEIDIMEHVGFEPDIVHFSIHTYTFNHRKGTQKTKVQRLKAPHTTFHIYGIEWREDIIIFFVDDKKLFTFPKLGNSYEVWPFDDKFHLLLNIAVGGDWGGIHGIDDSIFPQRMEVDYVRVYQRKTKN